MYKKNKSLRELIKHCTIFTQKIKRIPFKLKTYWNNNFLKCNGSRYVFSISFQKLLELTVAHILAIIISSSAKRIESHFNLYVNFKKIQSSNGITALYLNKRYFTESTKEEKIHDYCLRYLNTK